MRQKDTKLYTHAKETAEKRGRERERTSQVDRNAACAVVVVVVVAAAVSVIVHFILFGFYM